MPILSNYLLEEPTAIEADMEGSSVEILEKEKTNGGVDASRQMTTLHSNAHASRCLSEERQFSHHLLSKRGEGTGSGAVKEDEKWVTSSV